LGFGVAEGDDFHQQQVSVGKSLIDDFAAPLCGPFQCVDCAE
jgi:hypothetical protein